jgi:hypothetical protein
VPYVPHLTKEGTDRSRLRRRSGVVLYAAAQACDRSRGRPALSVPPASAGGAGWGSGPGRPSGSMGPVPTTRECRWYRPGRLRCSIMVALPFGLLVANGDGLIKPRVQAAGRIPRFRPVRRTFPEGEQPPPNTVRRLQRRIGPSTSPRVTFAPLTHPRLYRLVAVGDKTDRGLLARAPRRASVLSVPSTPK